ncbi:MAG: DUF2931 family protein [Bacteroidales bacterium]|nr:DUF2931 family protein [Bacteroidales bacterium]
MKHKLLLTTIFIIMAFKLFGQTYYWIANATGPRNFPTDLEWFYIKYGNDKACTIMRDYFHCGLSNTADCTYDKKRAIKNTPPKGVDAVWANMFERKFYVAEIDFTKDEINLIVNLLKTKYSSVDFNNKLIKGKYTSFIVGFLPEGELKFYLYGENYDRLILLPFTYQGKETHELDEKILHGTWRGAHTDGKFWDTIDDFYDELTFQGKYFKSLENIKKEDEDYYFGVKYYRENGFPHGLWKTYFRRFNYKINIEFEDKNAVIENERCYFTNGEYYIRYLALNPDNVIKNKSILRQMFFSYKYKNKTNYVDLYFSEKEIIPLFINKLGENYGEINILVKSDFKTIEITFKILEATYKIEKTGIEIDHLGKTIFKNFEGDNTNIFIGE